MALSRAQMREITELINRNLSGLHPDVIIDIKSSTYGGSQCRVTLTVSEVNEDGIVYSPEAEALKGLHENLLNMRFVSRGRTFTLNGYVPRRPKYPFLATTGIVGAQYKFPRGTIAAAAAEQFGEDVAQIVRRGF